MSHNDRAISEHDAYLTASPFDDEPDVDGCVNSFEEFLEQRGFGEKDIRMVSRNTFKYTNCGAFCFQEEDGVVVGSIVEGVDYGTENHKLTYPFKLEDFWAVLKKVEEEADQIWNETHGCEDCFDGEPFKKDWDCRPIDTECKSCKGKGAIK